MRTFLLKSLPLTCLELALCWLGPELQTLVAKKTSVVSWAMAYSTLPLQQALINVKKELQGDEEKKGSNLNGDWGKGHLKHCLKTAWGA